MVTDAVGTYLMRDTDSMAIVASEGGGLVPCVGAPYRFPDGREAVKALSWAEVKRIVARFESLNPYDRDAVPGSILKVEDVNVGPDGAQRELYSYAISAKRYALFTGTLLRLIDRYLDFRFVRATVSCRKRAGVASTARITRLWVSMR